MPLFLGSEAAEVGVPGLNKEPQFRAAQEHVSLLLRSKSRILDKVLYCKTLYTKSA